jgi:hypothetical protein
MSLTTPESHRDSVPLSSVEQRRKSDKLGQAMNSLQFLFKFVVKSRLLFSNLNGGKGAEPFEAMLREVLLALVKLMFASQQELLGVQASCLKHLVLAVPDLVTVFPRRQLAEILMKMITSLPMGQLTEIKLATLQAVVKCELFQHPDCRQVGIADDLYGLLHGELLGDIAGSVHQDRRCAVQTWGHLGLCCYYCSR